MTPAYEDGDAEALIAQNYCRMMNQPFPPSALHPLRHRSHQPLAPTGLGSIECGNQSCRTASGTRTKGSKTCVKLLCRTCCIEAAHTAIQSGTHRNACKAHKQQTVDGGQESSLSVSALVPFPSASQNMVPQPQFVIDPSLFGSTSQPSTQSRPVPKPSDSAPLNLPANPTTSRSKPLAQPVPKAWQVRYDEAARNRDSARSLKVQRQEMEDRAKRTIDVIFYFSVSYITLACTCS